jgi:hypothetical protein
MEIRGDKDKNLAFAKVPGIYLIGCALATVSTEILLKYLIDDSSCCIVK